MTKWYVLDFGMWPPGQPIGMSSRIPEALYTRLSSSTRRYYKPEPAAKAAPAAAPCVRVAAPPPPPPSPPASEPRPRGSAEGSRQKIAACQALDAADHLAWLTKLKATRAADLEKRQAEVTRLERASPPAGSSGRVWDHHMLDLTTARNELAMARSRLVRTERELAAEAERVETLKALAPFGALEQERIRRRLAKPVRSHG